MTHSGNPKFVVKEYATGETWIALEDMGALPGFERRIVGFDLPPGTSVAQAQAIARDLQDKLRAFKVVHL